MARLFKNLGNENMSLRGKLIVKYESARINLLLAVSLTFFNIILTLFGGDIYFLFSAFVPYYIARFGAFVCGKLPDYYYEDTGLTAADFMDTSLLIGYGAIAIILASVYLICWIFSKKEVGWLIAALVFFSFDLVFMLWRSGISVDMIIDLLYQALVLYYLIAGIRAHYKLQALPAEIEETEPIINVFSDGTEDMSGEEQTEDPENGENIAPVNSPILRKADWTVKGRILLEVEALGHKICYRRVKRTNELIIDSYVYDDMEILIENAHALTAQFEGHTIQVGFDGFSKSYVKIDGDTVAEKRRLF